MVIRFTKATKFLVLCLILALCAVISVTTRTVTVSTPVGAVAGQPLYLLVYRTLGESEPTAPGRAQVQSDLEFLKNNGFIILSEQELLKTLRREEPLPVRSVVLLFNTDASAFKNEVKNDLEKSGTPYFSLRKIAALTQELRAVGCPVTQVERNAAADLDFFLRLVYAPRYGGL
jgi:hypothetical protein